MSDRELVVGYLKGHEKAVQRLQLSVDRTPHTPRGDPSWDTLCERYTGEFFGFFVHKVQNREDAKALVQETLIEAMVNLSKLKNSESFRAWLYKIAQGCLAKFFRDSARRGIHAPLEEISAEGIAVTRAAYSVPAYQQPENLAIAQEHLDIVHSMVNLLPKSGA